MEVSTARRAIAYTRREIAGRPPHRCVSVKTLTIYIELPLVLHLRARNIWHAGATVEKLSGIFDTRHECEDAGCCVAVGACLPARRFHEFKTSLPNNLIITICIYIASYQIAVAVTNWIEAPLRCQWLYVKFGKLHLCQLYLRHW